MKLSSRLWSFVQFIRRLGLATTQMLVVTLLAWQLLRLYPGDRWLPVRLGSYFAPWLFMALIPALAMALWGRRRWLIWTVLLLTLVFGGRYWPLFMPRLPLASAETRTSQLRVMTFNVHFTNPKADDIAGLIRAESPDIIALQELTEGLAALLLSELASDYPYYLNDNSQGWPMVLISRYPLQRQTKSPDVWRAQRATVETPEGMVTIWNVHPPPALNQASWEVQKQILTAIATEIKAENGPLIVLGDFNTTDQAENYELIANQLSDVHRATGRGFGFTYPDSSLFTRLSSAQFWHTIRPVVRIDHIFVSQHFVPQETHVIPSGFGSDHRPVVARLRFAN